MNLKELIEKARSILLRYRQTREKYVNALARLPEGKLKADDRNGVKYYYYSVGGRQVYLGRKHPELVKALKERRFAEESIAVIDKNERCLENLIENLESAAPENILKKMPKSYMPEDGESSLCETELFGEEWGKRAYQRKASLDRYKNPSQLTLKGEHVRSKSEQNIANMLYMKGIPYHYEEEHKFGEDTLAPDFTVYVKSDGSFKLLEHCGVMNNPKYRSDLAWKMYVYIKNGYMPFRDVFFTFDDADGNLDTRFIEHIIDTYMT